MMYQKIQDVTGFLSCMVQPNFIKELLNELLLSLDLAVLKLVHACNDYLK